MKLPDDLTALTFRQLDTLYNVFSNRDGSGAELEAICAEFTRRDTDEKRRLALAGIPATAPEPNWPERD